MYHSLEYGWWYKPTNFLTFDSFQYSRMVVSFTKLAGINLAMISSPGMRRLSPHSFGDSIFRNSLSILSKKYLLDRKNQVILTKIMLAQGGLIENGHGTQAENPDRV
jgi:hypothetical protein